MERFRTKKKGQNFFSGYYRGTKKILVDSENANTALSKAFIIPAIGRKGGKARLLKLTAEKRKEIARKAIAARWAKAKTKR
jgi:hypothetical protein